MATLHRIEQLADGGVVGHNGSLGLLSLTPEGQMHRRGHDVLIGNADIGTQFSFFIERTDGPLVGWRNGGNDNRSSLNMIGIELDASLRLAVFVGRLVHHEDFLFRTDAGEMAVIANANQQTTTIGVGKGRHRLGQFAGISHTVFEVLLLMLALLNEVEKMTLVVHTVCKDKGFISDEEIFYAFPLPFGK